MDNEKRKAERHFNDQAIKEAVKRMTPELEAASEAAHKMKDSDDNGDDDYRDFDRTAELGHQYRLHMTRLLRSSPTRSRSWGWQVQVR